ncbi:MAG: glucose dehydrogenase [Schumannella sp.]|nr:glucose dehydrogenase [Schumannella sp.]
MTAFTTVVVLTLAVGVGAASTAVAPPASAEPASRSAITAQPLSAVGNPVNVATGLKVPWSILQLHDSAATVLVSERDTGVIERVTATGGLDPVGTVPGVHHVSGGEGGLLGLATLVDGGTRWIYAYLSTASDNRIVRMVYNDPGDPADASLGAPQVILSGLNTSTNHNGGRIAFGPDGMLYATVGDTNVRTLPQNVGSLNGKILRMTPTGGVPADNPFAGSLVYSLGHRNPQGLAWDASGQLWASELGQHAWDEFNRIVPGGNYGWPVVEGITSDARYINPWAQWPTSQASPSGLVYIDGTFFMASLGGKRLWTIYVDPVAGTAISFPSYINTLGRLRDVAAGPGGTLWILTNNTARGTVRAGDDRISQVSLVDAGRVDGVIDCATCALPGALKINVTLQHRTGTTWTDYQTVRVGGGPGAASGFAFPAVAPGQYRVVTRDVGGDGYLPRTTPSFTIVSGQAADIGVVRMLGSQLDRDLTGDGLNDLLAVTTAGALVRYDGASGGGFAAPQTVDPAWTASATAQVGDFDGDGFADAVARNSAGELWLYRGDGAGGWIDSSRIVNVVAGQNLLVGPGDFNGDGRADIIIRDTSGRLWLWRGNGAGGVLSPRTQIGTGWSGLTVMPAGDFNGDLRADLVARTSAGELMLYPGSGAGTFSSKVRFSTGWKTFTAVLSIGDVTADAHSDIIGRDSYGALRVYPGTGVGKLKPMSVLPGTWDGLAFAS